STPSPNRMERALSIPSWPASNGPVYSTKTRMPPRRGRSPAKFSTTGTPSPPSSPIPICRPPTTMPRQHSGMRSSQGGSASEREPRKGRALMRPSSASLKPAGGERSMRGVSSQKPSGMPGEANRQRPSRHLPNPGKVNGYDGDYPLVGRHISRRTHARRLSPSDLRRTLPDLRPHAKRPLAGRHSAPAWRSSLDDQARAGSQHRREELSLQTGAGEGVAKTKNSLVCATQDEA